MHTLLSAAFLGSAVLISSGALAQDTAQQPVMNNNGSGTAASSGDMAMQNGFVTHQPANQLSASNLIGANVVGTDNQSIGDVDDMLLDQDGRVTAVTVDVGGFLGIGEKTVAIPVQSLQFVAGMASANSTAANGTPATGTPGTTGTAMAPNTTAATGTMAPNTTAATNGTMAQQTGTGAAPATNMPANTPVGNAFGWGGGRLDHVQVNFTRDQLQNAPEFDDDNG